MNNRIKSRYLRVVLLSLLFLLTAGQINAKMIYFENNINWSDVKVHMWGNVTGDVDMSSTGDGKWYSAEIDDNAKDLLFYNGYWNDNNQTGNLSYPIDGKNAFVWNGDGGWKGYWETYNPTPVEATWTVVGNKAILNGSTDWDTNNTANDMVKGANGTYTLTVEKTNLAAGNYEYKVVKNHSYSDGEFPSGQNNNTLTISEAGDYTIVYTYDGESSLTATATKKVTKVETPTFTPAGGTYDAAQSVTIACATDGATIYYTTDGSNPTTSSTQYSGAIAVNATTTLKAFAVKDGMTDSEVATATYTINIPTPTLPVYKVHGGLHTGSGWYTEGVEMTDADGDGIYTYTFTKQADNWNNYFYVTKNGSRLGADNTTLVLNSPVTYFELAGAEFNISGNLINGNEYILTLNTNDKTLCVNGATPAPTRKFDLKTVKIFGGVTDDNQWNEDNSTEMTKVNDDVYTWTYTWKGVNNHWSFRVQKSNDSWVTLEKPIEVTPGNPQELVEHNNHGVNNEYYYNGMEQGKRYTITLNAFDGTVSIESAGNGIPVYPRGVQSETELEAYNFASNPVVYLMSNMLNNNRVTPEWQMISDGNGNYHLNGFAARTASDYKVRVYTSATSYVESASVSIDCNDGNASLAEGKLYNASVALNEGNYVLTLTEDESANGRMPFISLVGFAMQQDQVYQTPRAFEGHPSDVTTAKGWQEAWLLHDENGKLVKDRQEHVIYNTMWPPKNPVYFTATIGDEQRTYSSEQMTFKAQNNYVAKTGKEWKAELLAGENGEAYANLGTGTYKLIDEVEYVRYVVPDIWYVGSAKVWTGWNGEAYYNNGWKAMWSHHANWGYENKRATDVDGTDVVAEQPYYLSTDDNYNGNFKFDNPTYFKTIEFFYNTANRNESRLYTTLAFGNAQIEAQSHKEGDAYDRGMYKPTVTPGEGVTILSYIIRCYDAATNELVTLNNGIVAQDNQGNSPSSLTFVNDALGLAEGKYYYEMEVVFQTAAGTRTATVRSNPFIIHFPGVYTLEPVALQLVKAGDTYVTYNKNTENAPLFRATINENNQLTAVVPVAESERNGLFTMFKSNTGFDWTDKVLVVAPVPAQFKLDAEKAATVMSIEDYTLNTNLTVNKAVDGSMAYLDNAGKFTDKVYTAVMNYKEDVNSEVKQSMAKPASALMMRPNPIAVDDVVVTVTPQGSIGTESTIDGMAVPANAEYYTVSVEMPFGKANVTDDASAPKYIAVMGDQPAELSQAGTVTFNNVNPLTFVKDIKVTAVYPDGDNNYTLEANVGDPVSCNGETDGFKKNAQISFTGNFEPVFNKDQAGVKEIHMSVPQGVYDKISEFNLEMQYFKTQAFLGEDKKEVLNTLLTDEQLNFADYVENSEGHKQTALRFNVDGITLTSGMPVSMKATPVYFVKVDESISVPGSGPAQAPALKAEANEATYVALYGNEAVVEPTTDGIVTGVNDITVDGVKAYKVIENGQVIIVRGSERFNIMGQPVR